LSRLGVRARARRAAENEGHRREQPRDALGRRAGRHARRALRDRQPDQGRCGRQPAMGESTARSAGIARPDGAGGGVALTTPAAAGEGTMAMTMETHGAHLDEVYPTLPFTPVRGRGAWLEDAGGRRVLDLYGGHAVAALGYAHPRLTAALARQAEMLHFQSNILPLPIRDEAAAKLAAFAPAGLERVFFVNSGAEANENALRIALRTTG